MDDILNIFNSIEHLEPKCPKCSIILKYGINTRFDEKEKVHRCNSCNTIIR